ncbi:MAG TPA: M28 family peptidase, partial [Rhizomicrobium sp.]
MSLRAFWFLALLILPLPALAQDAAAQWWADVSALANDGMKGRLTGTEDYLRATDYVIARLNAEGLMPAGTKSYLQPVDFEQQLVDQDASTAALVAADGTSMPVKVGDTMLIAPGGGSRPAQVDAPLVFIGYGLNLPKQGYDDLAGLDLKGKIAVVVSGGPDTISGPIKSDARSARNKALVKAGAIGILSLVTPKQVEIVWSRQKLIAHGPGMYLADKSLRDTPDGFFSATFDPEKSDMLFAGSGHSFAEICALSDASKPVPRFALPLRLKAGIAATRSAVTSPNIVAKLEGADPRLKSDYVVVSAHLDHLGVGEPINGDRIYNGAMDDASGVAAVLDIAHRLKTGPRPKRSILFVL